MVLSRQSLVDRAFLRNQSRGDAIASIPLARYDALEPQARTLMAQLVAAHPEERVRNQLKKDFSVTVTSGVGSLAASVTASEPMLDHTLDKSTVTSGDSTLPWQYIPTYEELSLSRPTFGMIFFTVKNGSLICTDTTGTPASLSTTATVSAGYIPLASTISGNLDLEELAIAQLAGLVAGQPMEAPSGN